MKIICAWCSKIITKDDGKGGRDSHGICPACEEIMNQDLILKEILQKEEKIKKYKEDHHR